MNTRNLKYVGIIIVFGLFFISSCTKNADGTVTVIPLPPTALKATTFSTTAINLTWIDNSTNEDGFKIERKNGAADFSLIATLGVDKISYKDSLLTPYTTYTYRVYSYNSAGKSTTYSNLDSASTNGVPLLTTRAIDSLSYTSAKSGGVITNSGGASVIAKGIVWSTTNTPSIDLATKTNDGVDTGNYKSSITGLTPGTLYNVWAFATNSKGTAFGNMVSFTTLSLALPTISTDSVTVITSTSAKSGGKITSDGGADITTRGICWSTTANPTTANSKTTDGSGIGIFTSSITGLNAATQYYVRSYATNSVGTAYGEQFSFTTIENQTFVIIGTQVWQKKNLDVSTYRNGDIIPQVTDVSAWAALTTGAWCYLNNDAANDTKYGKLYNWYAVNDPRGLAPAGWHIPTDAEWTILSTTYLGGDNAAGGKMKEVGTLNWQSPNNFATNESGFSGLPGSARAGNGRFPLVSTNGQYGYWWSTTEYDFQLGRLRSLANNSGLLGMGSVSKKNGHSVRCLRD